jgi:hypothetical protein
MATSKPEQIGQLIQKKKEKKKKKEQIGQVLSKSTFW